MSQKDLLGNFQYKPSTPAKHDHVILDMHSWGAY